MAFGKPTWQSTLGIFGSMEGNSYKAVDGTSAGFNHGDCTHTIGDDNVYHTWAVDLQANYTVSHVIITNRDTTNYDTGCCCMYTLKQTFIFSKS